MKKCTDCDVKVVKHRGRKAGGRLWKMIVRHWSASKEDAMDPTKWEKSTENIK